MKYLTFWQEKLTNGPLRTGLQGLLFLAVCAYIIYRLSEIGWSSVLTAAPTSPWFYFTLMIAYLVLPISEVVIYGRLWRTPLWRYLQVFLRKRVLNEAFLGYSGEAYLLIWAKRRLGLADGSVFGAVKDNNLISAAVSTALAMLLTLTVVASGQLQTITRGDPHVTNQVVGAVGICVILLPVILFVRRRYSALPTQAVRRLLIVNGLRLTLTESLQIVQWVIALPVLPYGTWLVFLTGQTLLTRIPFLPNKELMILGLGVTLSRYVGVSGVQIAGMLIAGAAATQCLNLLVFIATSLRTQTAQMES